MTTTTIPQRTHRAHGLRHTSAGWLVLLLALLFGGLSAVYAVAAAVGANA